MKSGTGGGGGGGSQTRDSQQKKKNIILDELQERHHCLLYPSTSCRFTTPSTQHQTWQKKEPELFYDLELRRKVQSQQINNFFFFLRKQALIYIRRGNIEMTIYCQSQEKTSTNQCNKQVHMLKEETITEYIFCWAPCFFLPFFSFLTNGWRQIT